MESARLATASTPSSGATVTLFNSVTAYGAGMMRTVDLTRIQVNFLNVSHASAASGLIPYASSNGGTNWDQIDFRGTMPVTVAASTTGQDNVYDFWVAPYDDFKLTYTASANTYTAWRVTVTAYFGEVHPGF